MKVIRAQLSDVSQAAPLFAAYREFYGEPYDLDASASFLASRLARDESIVLIAKNDAGVPVGFSQIYPAFSSTRLAPIWILNDLFVSEDARGTGAVDELLDTAATLAVEAGAIAIELATAHTNLRAQAVYDRSGYEVDTVYKHYEKPLPLTTDWSSIGDIVKRSVDAGDEIGAGVSVWHGGEEVVSLAVGTRNAAGDPWEPDTLVHTYSVAKPFAALAALSAVADGAIGLDQPIVDVWPEFGANGKAATTLRHVLSHQSGVFAFPESAASIDPLDGEALVELLADAVPFHAPGDGLAEHALTYGHLLHGVVQRATGQGLADRFATLATTYDWDLQLSVPEADLPRVADLAYVQLGWAELYLTDPNTALTASLDRPHGPLDIDLVNSERWRTGWFPAIGLHASASALARFYAELLEPDGPVAQLLGPELLREYTSVQATGHDLVLDREVSWTLGFQRDDVEIGMGGIGGSSAWVSTAKGYSCAYVTRGLATHDRVDAVWEQIERLL